MSEKTPGRAAYEAYEDASAPPGEQASWDVESDENRDAWEAAAAAGAAAAHERTAELLSELNAARAVVRELLGFIDSQQIDLIGPKQLAAMAKRAGLEAVT